MSLTVADIATVVEGSWPPHSSWLYADTSQAHTRLAARTLQPSGNLFPQASYPASGNSQRQLSISVWVLTEGLSGTHSYWGQVPELQFTKISTALLVTAKVEGATEWSFGLGDSVYEPLSVLDIQSWRKCLCALVWLSDVSSKNCCREYKWYVFLLLCIFL